MKVSKLKMRIVQHSFNFFKLLSFLRTDLVGRHLELKKEFSNELNSEF